MAFTVVLGRKNEGCEPQVGEDEVVWGVVTLVDLEER